MGRPLELLPVLTDHAEASPVHAQVTPFNMVRSHMLPSSLYIAFVDMINFYHHSQIKKVTLPGFFIELKCISTKHLYLAFQVGQSWMPRSTPVFSRPTPPTTPPVMTSAPVPVNSLQSVPVGGYNLNNQSSTASRNVYGQPSMYSSGLVPGLAFGMQQNAEFQQVESINVFCFLVLSDSIVK